MKTNGSFREPAYVLPGTPARGGGEAVAVAGPAGIEAGNSAAWVSLMELAGSVTIGHDWPLLAAIGRRSKIEQLAGYGSGQSRWL